MISNKHTQNLYEAVIVVTDNYLGPASERFVDRHIRNHLNKEPHELQTTDLPELIKWIHATVSVITEDRDMITKYIDDLKHLHTNFEATS